MPLQLEGDVHDDQVHRIFKTLFERELLDPLALWPFLTVSQDINAPTYGYKTYSKTNEGIYIAAPPGKVWELLFGSFAYVCDANVADRTIRMQLYGFPVGSISGASLYHPYEETRAANETGQYSIGAPVPNANPAAYDFLDAKLIVTENIRLYFYAAANGQAGDALTAAVIYKETVNYEP